MRRWGRAILVAPLLALCALRAAPAAAQPPSSSIGIFFDPTATTHTAQVVVGQPFDAYVIALQPLGGIYAFELAVVVDPRLNVLSRTAAQNSDDVLPGDDNWAVGLRSECLLGLGPFVLLTYRLAAREAAADLTLCLTGSTPSSFDPAVPAHLDCNLSGPYPFTLAYTGCAAVGATPTPAAAASLGTIKARYRGAP
jgi:hypothetical protein